jgi:alginate O-acetyltransferase complex protein AlgI
MLFNSIQYLVFFPLVFALYWAAPKRWRRFLLLLASYLFYMSWIPVYGLLIFGMTVCNYLLGLLVARFRGQAEALFVFGVAANLATLCYFKYTNFILSSIGSVYQSIGQLFHLQLTRAPSSFDVILPLGISFFAFEFIHYLTDVYKGGAPIRGPIEFGLFAAFFPSQIAGPIKRYQDFVAQLNKPSRFDANLAQEGAGLFLQGLFKKVALADNLASLANPAFAAAHQVGTVDAWLAVLAFTLQIYCDFSGYTDMGRGSAMMLGFSLPDNFNFPYLARSVQDFWRRWHISLSSWLRDYLYIPLGGGRCSDMRKYANLMITMLLGGLWHGAAWHFVIWGGYQGAGLVANHKYDQLVQRMPMLQRLHASPLGVALSTAVTFFFVMTSWTLFRADTLAQALDVMKALIIFKPSAIVVALLPASYVGIALFIYGVYALVFALPNYRQWRFLSALRARLTPRGFPARAATCVGLLVLTLGFAPLKASPFIYFQF